MTTQHTATFETVQNLVTQLSLVDQTRLLEWTAAQIKQNFNAALKSSRIETKHYLTGKELAQSELVGLWKDRNISDSVAYANDLRRQAQTRVF